MGALFRKERLKEQHPAIFDALRFFLTPFRRIRNTSTFKRSNDERYFKASFQRFSRSVAESGDYRFELSWAQRMPILHEDTGTTGFDAHYVYHTSWAARLLSQNHPALHHDFASDIRFATLVSAFIPMVFYDYRPLLVQLSDLCSERADLLNLQIDSESVRSLSCMHVVEHIGLGRYGDPIDPQGDLKAMKGLKRILAPGGDLYFVVPIGQPVLKFNAHRIYSYDMIMEYFSEYRLKEFSLITDEGRFMQPGHRELADEQVYGCGCFWFKK